MTEKIILLLLTIYLCGCRLNENNNLSQAEKMKWKKAASSVTKFAYLQSNYEYQSADYEDDNGEIYVYDLADSSRIKVTDDGYTKRNLSWSPDGTKLLYYRRKQEQFPSMNNQLEEDLIVADFKKGTFKKVFPFRIHSFHEVFLGGIQWTRKGIYFAVDNYIYKITESGDSLKTEITLEPDVDIWNIRISPKEDYMVIECRKGLDTFFAVYNMHTSDISWLGQLEGSLRGWSDYEESFLIDNWTGLFLYDISGKSTGRLNYYTKNDRLMSISCDYLNKNELIYLACENYRTVGKNVRNADYTDNIIIYNIESGKFWIPFKNKKLKNYLTVYKGSN